MTERLKGFREGWALKNGGRAHYFRRAAAGIARSLCGAQDAPAGYLFDAGEAERCRRCAKLAAEIGKDCARRVEC